MGQVRCVVSREIRETHATTSPVEIKGMGLGRKHEPEVETSAGVWDAPAVTLSPKSGTFFINLIDQQSIEEPGQ
ncbi:MAG TPA: hypothetical protein ENF23_07670 [Methanosarcinales archaeon]|nr:hypothetical protein [Methanosarcinales archaeon]